MFFDGVNYDIVCLSDEDFKKINISNLCGGYKEETLIVNCLTKEYFHCGDLKNRPIRNPLAQLNEICNCDKIDK